MFSRFDEDGVLLFLLAAGGLATRRFVDIGCGSACANSNVANVIFNWGFWGLGLDGNSEAIAAASALHNCHPATCEAPSKFISAMVGKDNINTLVREAGMEGEVDVLSIDIDGHDYWVWAALDGVQPRIVVVEAHIEFGRRSSVAPYDESYVYTGKHPEYHGASPAATAKPAARKGYTLVGANIYGFNTFYMRNDILPAWLRKWTVEDVPQHPRNRECETLVEPIKDGPMFTPDKGGSHGGANRCR